MIYLYSGTPGSGKSLHATQDIISYLRRGKPVIANYSLNLTEYKSIRKARFVYVDNSEITPEYLTSFSKMALVQGKENQALIVLDECGILLNCRDFTRNDRARWVTFFQQHRKLGYNVILISQYDRMIDKQIRSFIEYEVVHRKVNNAGSFGIILRMLHIPFFLAISKWYGVKMIVNREIVQINKRLLRAYNSYELFVDSAPHK